MIVSRALDLKIGAMDQGQVVTDDGTRLLYQTFGSGPAVVIANGIGVRYPGAVMQATALRDRCRVICWDYRGMGQSVMPDPDHGDISMPRHGRDILTILDHLEVERAVFIGWSMGVQVSLEVIDQAPERVAGLVALLGTYGRPFRNAFPAPVASAVESSFLFLHHHPAIAQAALNLAVALPRAAFWLLSKALFVGADADQEVFNANVRSVAGVEKKLYTRTLLELARHDAAHVLPRVRCPALIVAGERDHITPPRVARWMASVMPQATYREVKSGTHFALIEQHDLVNGWIRELVERALPREPV